MKVAIYTDFWEYTHLGLHNIHALWRANKNKKSLYEKTFLRIYTPKSSTAFMFCEEPILKSQYPIIGTAYAVHLHRIKVNTLSYVSYKVLIGVLLRSCALSPHMSRAPRADTATWRTEACLCLMVPLRLFIISSYLWRFSLPARVSSTRNTLRQNKKDMVKKKFALSALVSSTRNTLRKHSHFSEVVWQYLLKYSSKQYYIY